MERLNSKIVEYLTLIYPEMSVMERHHFCGELIEAIGLDGIANLPAEDLWSERDVMLITYGDSIRDRTLKKETLPVLDRFIGRYIDNTFSWLHILPFNPYSSDDGFSVINYREINPILGDWQHITHLTKRQRVMADLVLNHCSAYSLWFQSFLNNDPGTEGYFVEVDDDEDVSMVVRPRPTDLKRPVQIGNRASNVWCTFSHDQVDLNYKQPKVLLEMVAIMGFYLSQGISIFRLDAVAFLWKELPGNCINHPNTHRVIQLLRLLVEAKQPNCLLISETNIPHKENISYWGEGNEAHIVYNFTLAPLLLFSFTNHDASLMNSWLKNLEPAPKGCTFLNFIASHDGIGLRPLEGLIDDKTLQTFLNQITDKGAKISYRRNGNKLSPYEINVSLYSALADANNPTNCASVDKFICAHAVMLALKGVPAFYIHSLLGTENDVERSEMNGINRHINRRRWDINDLGELLSKPNSHHPLVLERIKHLIEQRKTIAQFSPEAKQEAYQCSKNLILFKRSNAQGELYAVYSVSDTTQTLDVSDVLKGESYLDRLTQQTVVPSALKLLPYQFYWLVQA